MALATNLPTLSHGVTTLREEFGWFSSQARTPLRRSMRHFAEQEIIIPDGPYEGRRFDCRRQPYAGLWFDACDSNQWKIRNATGPTQSGKSLCCFVIPTLYHLFETQDTVICGLPDLDMRNDKWQEDFLPAIEPTRYRELLPSSGAGSRGGIGNAVRFKNGCTLRFMTGGGKDKARSAFTARVLVITESDGMDAASPGSREANKIKQLKGRVRAYGERALVYSECTVSIVEGYTWQTHKNGTESRIALPCPHCGEHVSPEREHLVGHEGCASVVEARLKTSWFCPLCSEAWTERERKEANLSAKLVHRGQTIDSAGTIHGEPPATETLGFRWSAVNNMFSTAGDVGVDEYNAAAALDEDDAEKEIRQFVFALPYKPPIEVDVPLTYQHVVARGSTTILTKGLIPEWAHAITVGVDLGKWLCHWTAIAWLTDASGHIFDYGQFDVPSDQFNEDLAITLALKTFRDDVTEAGWPVQGSTTVRRADMTWIDSRYMGKSVHAFIADAATDRRRYYAAQGASVTQTKAQFYNRPKKTGAIVKHLGEEFHISQLPRGLYVVQVNADYWKSRVHKSLLQPTGGRGAVTLFKSSDKNEHIKFGKHLTAEKKEHEYVPGKGVVTRWVQVRRANHWNDSTYNGFAAAGLLGVHLHEPPPPPAGQTNQEPAPRFSQPGRTAFLLTER